MPDAYESLSSLRTLLKARREDMKEKIAKGVEDKHYHELAGRCRELADTVDKINQQIRSLHGETDEADIPGTK